MLLVEHQEMHLAVLRCWHGYLSGARGSDLHMVQLFHCHRIISGFIKIHNGLTFLVPAYPGCPGK